MQAMADVPTPDYETVVAGTLRPAPFFVLRTPLLPITDFLATCAVPDVSDAEALSAARVADSSEQVVRFVRTLLRRRAVREALYLASPGVMAAFGRHLQNAKRRYDPKLALSLFKYVTRICSRATPFGLLAGQTIGVVGRRTFLTLPELHAYERTTLIDSEALQMWADEVIGQPSVRDDIALVVNSTLYQSQGEWRYLAPSETDSTRFELNALADSSALCLVIAMSREGAPRRELVRALARSISSGNEPDGDDVAEAEDYVNTLLRYDVLRHGLNTTQTGAPPQLMLYRALASVPSAKGYRAALRKQIVALRALDRAGIGVPLRRYRALLPRTHGRSPLASRNLVNASLWKPEPRTSLGPRVIAAMNVAIEVLHRVGTPVWHGDLDQFAERFAARYGDAEVPLTHALDDDAGIGFPPPSADARPPDNSERESAIQDLLHKTLASGASEMRLSDDDLTRLENRTPQPLPDSVHCAAMIVASSAEDIDRDRFTLVMLSCAGPSGVKLLARFCHANRQLRRLVQAQINAEQATSPDALCAEIVHSPTPRADNVISRPAFREYDIPIFGRSGRERSRQLMLDDLTVSVRGGRIMVASRRLGRTVTPRLTCAHLFRQSPLAAYRFLAALQEQALAHVLTWSWGALEKSPWLPRVAFKNVILARARWIVRSSELPGLSRGTDVTLLR